MLSGSFFLELLSAPAFFFKFYFTPSMFSLRVSLQKQGRRTKYHSIKTIVFEKHYHLLSSFLLSFCSPLEMSWINLNLNYSKAPHKLHDTICTASCQVNLLYRFLATEM